jgi:hypothetical protein
MPGGCTLSAHGAGKLIVKTDRQAKTEKDMYAKLSYGNTAVTNPARRGKNHHHVPMAPRANIDQCYRHVAHGMAKCIHIASGSANMTYLTKILVVNHKQLSNNIIDPLFLYYLWVDSVKVEPQWAKYPSLSVRRFMRLEKPILEFYFTAKTVQYIGHLFACAYHWDMLTTCFCHTSRGAVRETRIAVH